MQDAPVTPASTMKDAITRLLGEAKTAALRTSDGMEHHIYAPFGLGDDHISYRLGPDNTWGTAITPYSSIIQIMLGKHSLKDF